MKTMGKNKSKTSCFGEVFETILKAMMHGGTVLDFSESVSKTVNNMTIGKLSLLPTREEIVIDDEERKTTMNVNRISSHYDLYSATGIFNEKEITDIIGNDTTFVIPVKKKDALISELKSAKGGLLGYLNAVSLWDHVLNNINDDWEKMNISDKSTDSNIMYLPGIIIPFMDYYGHLLKEPKKIDVIIVSIPSIKNANEGIEEMSIIDYNKKCINDVLEAAIHFNAKNIITIPTWCKQTCCTANADLWEHAANSKRVTDNINTINLVVIK